MDYFSRKPDFPTFEDIYIARTQAVTVRLGRIDPDELDPLHLFLRH